jgi:NADH-quinone oxidoreductase subunit K
MPGFGFDLLTSYLIIGAILMALGMLGFLTRRNLIIMFLSVEMMLQGAALSLVAFSAYHGNWTGQVFTIVMLTVAGCEAAMSLALTILLFNRRKTLDVAAWQDLREGGLAPIVDSPENAEPLQVAPGVESYPRLTPAGIEPPHPRQPWEQRRG